MLASGLSADEESVFIYFLSIIEPLSNKTALECISETPDYYWRLRWGLLLDRDRDWIARAAQLPLRFHLDHDWYKLDDSARQHICQKTQSMAKRAMQLVQLWKTELAADRAAS